MPVSIKRAYDARSDDDGYRVLVDRLWPRGMSNDTLAIDQWLRRVAPSDELRRGFHLGEIPWDDFRTAYLSELKAHREALRPLAERAKREPVTLVFSSKDTEHNNAVVLKQYLGMLGG